MGLLQVRVDDETKNKASTIYEALGLDLSTAVRLFLMRSISEGGIPFDMKIDKETLEGIIALKSMQQKSIQNGNDKMSLDDINSEIKKVRDMGEKDAN